MNTKAKFLLLVTVISLPPTMFMYMKSYSNNAPLPFNSTAKVERFDGHVSMNDSLQRSQPQRLMNDSFEMKYSQRPQPHLSMNDYFEMKYSQQPQPQRLMNMSLTVAESGALSLRVSPEATDSLDFDMLMRRALFLQRITPDQGGATSNGAREAPLLVKEDITIHHNNTAVSTIVSNYGADDHMNGTSRKIKHILYWGKYSSFSNCAIGVGEEAFIKQNCPVSACSATDDPLLVPESQVDAILYCLDLNDARKLKLPPSLPRFPNAIRAVMGRESPALMRRPLEMYRHMFDYTMTYRYDSDARAGYGNVAEVSKKYQNDSFIKIEEVTRHKSKMAAWFVSNCWNVPSNRDKLTKEMQKHGVDVDIYGACGHLKCERSSETDCFKMLEKDYKFYLSFENSLCNHYFTEKFMKIVRYNIVPVTYGLGHELSGVPKEAYIDVFDFPDVKSLAQHLLYLASNDSAYNEYFRWKNHLRDTGYSGEENYFCKLCADLHADPPPPQKKYDLQAWFSEGQCIDVSKNPRLKNFLGIAN